LISLGTVLNIILGLAFIVFEIFLIKKFFNIKWGKAIGMWFVWLAFTTVLIVLFIILMWGLVSTVIQ